MDPVDREFRALLAHVKEARGVDFTGYKRPSLVRRVRRRMTVARVDEYGEYLDHLQVHPAVNRRGRTITVRMGCSSLRGGADGPGGAIILMETGSAIEAVSSPKSPGTP